MGDGVSHTVYFLDEGFGTFDCRVFERTVWIQRRKI
jgi:hypothetical protein